MDINIKGITTDSLMTGPIKDQVTTYSFDFRPTSFNFIQVARAADYMKQLEGEYQLRCLFENDSNLMITETLNKIEDLAEYRCLPEVFGQQSLEQMESLDLEYCWLYQNSVKLSELSDAKNLKKIILRHSDLQELNDSGELFGFLNIFNSMELVVEYELLLDWNTIIIESMFDYFKFNELSFEINQMVELSYQNPDVHLIQTHLNNIKERFK